MKTKDKLALIGSILVLFSMVVFFKSTRIYSWGFYRLWSTVSTGGILIALMLLDVILIVATKHKAAKIAMPVLIALLVLSIILGTRLSFTGTLLDLFLILIPAAVGAGLILRATLLKKDS